MKKIFVIAILGLGGLGFNVEQASAGCHLLSCLCCNKCCCVKMCAKQYNAFSPYCLDSLSGCIPMGGFAGNGGGYGPACNYADPGFAMGQLPAPGPIGSQAFGMPGMAPGETMQAFPGMAPGMMSPNSIPGGYYPTIIAPTPLPGPGR